MTTSDHCPCRSDKCNAANEAIDCGRSGALRRMRYGNNCDPEARRQLTERFKYTSYRGIDVRVDLRPHISRNRINQDHLRAAYVGDLALQQLKASLQVKGTAS
jgi:hypothetical protein